MPSFGSVLGITRGVGLQFFFQFWILVKGKPKETETMDRHHRERIVNFVGGAGGEERARNCPKKWKQNQRGWIAFRGAMDTL